MTHKKGTKPMCLVLAAVMSAGLMSACKTEKEPNGNAEKTQITVWSCSRSEMDVRKKQIEKFNNENEDGIEIIYDVKSDNYADLLKVAFMSDSAPDIFEMSGSALANMAYENSWLRAFDEDFVEECEERFIPGCIIRYPDDNRVYEMPLTTQTFKMIWNKELFREAGLDPETPPKTWDEIREYAKKITEIGQGKKYGFGLPLKQPIFARYYVTMPGAPSGLYNLDGYDPVKGEYDFTIYRPMVDLMKALQADGSLFPSPANLDNDLARAQFAEGNIGIMFGASWDVGVFNDQFPTKQDWGIAEFPTFDGELKGGYPYGIGGTSFAMNSQSKDAEKQLKVYKWLVSDEILTELNEAGKGPYALKSLNGQFGADGKKGAKEFGTITAPAHIINEPRNNPNSFIKLEGDDYSTTITNIIIADLDTEKELNALTERYNNALENLHKKDERDGKDPNRFVYPDFEFVSD